MRRLFWLSILLCPLFLMADDTTVEHIIETKHEYTIEEDAFIEVENMVGTLTIEPSENSKVQLASSFHAFSPEEARSTELAGKLRLDVVESPKKLTVRAEFPVEQHSLYYYPLAGGAKKQFSKGRTRMNYRGKEITFFSEPTPAAVYLFCDISIKVPQGMRMKVRNEVGIIHVKGFDGDLNCETSVAGQNIENGKGKVIAISGSGDVSITVFSGQAACYTASGKVNCRKMYGASELIVQTGSGPALFEGCILKELNIETGSGVIEVGKSKIDSMRTSTGSGKVSLDDCEVNNELKIETGSGSVKMKGDFSELQKMSVETGSGRIEFVSTPFPELQFDLFSAKGIKVQVPQLKAPRGTIHSFSGSIVEKPAGKAMIRSGSGQIRLATKDEG